LQATSLQKHSCVLPQPNDVKSVVADVFMILVFVF